jgi:hypothetical protein
MTKRRINSPVRKVALKPTTQAKSDSPTPQPHILLPGSTQSDDVLALQRVAGNHATIRLLNQSKAANLLSQKPLPGTAQRSAQSTDGLAALHLHRSPAPIHSIQRALVDGDSLDTKLGQPEYASIHNKSHTNLSVSIIDYKNFIKQKIDASAATGGQAFYTTIEQLLNNIAAQIDPFLKHASGKKVDTAWLQTLRDQDIPQTLGWAGKVRDNFASFTGKTYLEALKGVRESALMAYVKKESDWAWNKMSANEKDLLADKRDSDAAAVAAIRATAKEMMAKKRAPKDILNYMSMEAIKFVQKVVGEYVTLMGIQNDALVIVDTGSFGSGELFPYSDIDIQMMKPNVGNDKTKMDTMDHILHNIRQRIRLANMKETTLGWDVDQLVQGGYDAQSAVTQDKAQGLSHTNILYATGGGASEAKALHDNIENIRVARAVAKIEEVFTSASQGDWLVKNPSVLDKGAKEPLDFKEKFMRLPKIYLNVLAMYHGLQRQNSWSRIDELVEKNLLASGVGAQFKKYLDLTAMVRLHYQFFYEKEGEDTVSPNPTLVSKSLTRFPKGYYMLTADDRKALVTAQAIQQIIWQDIQATRNQMQQAMANQQNAAVTQTV